MTSIVPLGYYLDCNGKKWNHQLGGKIVGITGPMKASKSSYLITELSNHQIGNKNVVALTPVLDTRAEAGKIGSRNGLKFNAHTIGGIITIGTSNDDHVLNDSERNVEKMNNLMDPTFISLLLEKEYDVIGIDEGQFFGGLAEFCELMSNLGKVLYVSYLNGCRDQKMFESILKLQPHIDKTKSVKAICADCPYGNGRKAKYTILLEKDKEENAEGEVLIDDGSETMYKPVCQHCKNHYSNSQIVDHSFGR